MSIGNVLKIETIQMVFFRKVDHRFDERCSVFRRTHIGWEITWASPTSDRYEGIDSLYATQLVELVKFHKPVSSNSKLTFKCASWTNWGSKSGLEPAKVTVPTSGVVSLFVKSFKIGYMTKIDFFIYAKAYVRWVYFDQLTFDRGNPSVECHPAYQAEATELEVLPSTLRVVKTKMGSQESTSRIMIWG